MSSGKLKWIRRVAESIFVLDLYVVARVMTRSNLLITDVFSLRGDRNDIRLFYIFKKTFRLLVRHLVIIRRTVACGEFYDVLFFLLDFFS